MTGIGGVDKSWGFGVTVLLFFLHLLVVVILMLVVFSLSSAAAGGGGGSVVTVCALLVYDIRSSGVVKQICWKKEEDSCQ